MTEKRAALTSSPGREADPTCPNSWEPPGPVPLRTVKCSPPDEQLLSLSTGSVPEMQLRGQGPNPAFPGDVLAETESEYMSMSTGEFGIRRPRVDWVGAQGSGDRRGSGAWGWDAGLGGNRCETAEEGGVKGGQYFKEEGGLTVSRVADGSRKTRQNH